LNFKILSTQDENCVSRRKWTLFAARLVANITLYTSVFVFLLISGWCWWSSVMVGRFVIAKLCMMIIMICMKIIISDINIMINFSFSNLEVMTLYYLMVLPYFWIFWIWPSKCLIVAIDQKKPWKFLPWILSAMVHSAIIFGLYNLGLIHYLSYAFDAPLLASIALIFLLQVIVWIAWVEVGCCHRGRQSHSNGEEQGEENAFLQEGLGISEMSVGCEEAPPPPYSSVVIECEVIGKIEDESSLPPSYSELDLQKI